MMIRRWAVPSSVTAACVLLLTVSPHPGPALRQLRDTSTASDPTAPVVALLTLAAQALVLWLALATTATAAGHLPGLTGRACRAVARACVPAVVRRALEVALGVTVTVGTLGATPALAVSALPSAPAAGTSAPDLDWPVAAGPAATAAPPSSSEPLPSPSASPGRTRASVQPPRPSVTSARPTSVPAPPPTSSPRTRAPLPASSPRTRALRPAPTTPRPTSTPVDVVVVRPGDTLWDLAATALARADPRRPPTTAAIARAWPHWWSANREVIGDDPHLLLPGTALVPPDSPGAAPAP